MLLVRAHDVFHGIQTFVVQPLGRSLFYIVQVHFDCLVCLNSRFIKSIIILVHLFGVVFDRHNWTDVVFVPALVCFKVHDLVLLELLNFLSISPFFDFPGELSKGLLTRLVSLCKSGVASISRRKFMEHLIVLINLKAFLVLPLHVADAAHEGPDRPFV